MEESALKRISPNDLMAEQAVVGAMIRDNDTISLAMEMLTAQDFYSPKYGKIFENILKMNDEGSTVDIVTLRNRLMESGVPEEYYSLETLKDIVSAVPTSAHIENYAKIVAKKSTLRKLIRVSEDIQSECYSDGKSLDDIRSNWAIDRFFNPGMDEEKRCALLKGWNKAVKCALMWGED